MGKSKNKKQQKNELIFDNKKREEFLKGFSKRKKERQKKAITEIENKLKEERKRIKEESKNLKDKFKQSYKKIEELKDIVSDSSDDEEIEGVTIKISGVKEDSKFIGLRKVEDSSSEDEAEISEKDEELNKIQGMEMDDTKQHKSTANRTDKQVKELKSEKDFKKLIKKQTKSAIKKSKIIQMKNHLNHKKNLKMSHRKKYVKEKFLKKHKKIPKHNSRK